MKHRPPAVMNTRLLSKKGLLLVIAVVFLAASFLFTFAPQSASAITDAQLKKDALEACNTKNTNSWCVTGYINGYNGQSSQAVCTQWVGTSNYSPCVRGINLGRAAAGSAPVDAPVPTNDPATPSSASQGFCAGKKGKAAAACADGYDGQTNGKGKNASCQSYRGNFKTVCENAWDKSKSDTAAGNSADSPPDTTCDAGSFSLNWILCPTFNAVQSITQWVFDHLIKPLLMTNPICLDSTGQACDNTIYKVWSGFRIYGDVFLVIVLLVIVFGESIGGGLIDAYTAKKVLPRLLIAAVLINLSIYIMALLIDITNVVGGGIGQILTAPLGANGYYKIQPDGISQLEIFGGGATAGLLAGAFIFSTTGVVLLLLGLAITGVIAVFGVFITLIIRQAIIIALLLISPVAFALWCLPNTQPWFKRWWDTFFQMMLVYPMIIMAFAVADILGTITAHNTGSGSSALNNIVAFMLLVIPLYMIPFMLRSSNRILGAVQGAVSNVGRQINAVSGRRLLSASGQEAGKVFTKRRADESVFKNAPEGSWRHRINKGVSRAANIDNLGRSGLRPRNIRADLDAAMIANQNQARKKLAEESAAFQVFSGNDDMLEATGLLMHEGEAAARARLEKGGITGRQQQDTAIAQIRAAERQMGSKNLALSAAVANAGTGTGYQGVDDQGREIGQGNMYDEIIRSAGGDMQLAGPAYAEARGLAERARRSDLLESFSSAMQHMDAIGSSTTPSQRSLQIQRANEEGAVIAREVQGASAILGSRGQAVRRFIPVIQQAQHDALEAVAATKGGGNTTVRVYDSTTGTLVDETITAEEAQRRWIQQMASDSALIDSSGPAAPEVQRALADTAHNGQLDITALPDNLRELLTPRGPDGKPTGATTISMNEAYDRLEGTEAFRQMKKVFAQKYQADAIAAAAGGAPGGPAGPAPGSSPGT